MPFFAMNFKAALTCLEMGKLVRQSSEPAFVYELQPSTVPILVTTITDIPNVTAHSWSFTQFVLLHDCPHPYLKGAPWSFSKAQQAATDWEEVT